MSNEAYERNPQSYRAGYVAGLQAAQAEPVTVDREALELRIQDTLAYYRCRANNPKADHPRMGYHAFSESQREFLRNEQAEAAAEVVRIFMEVAAQPVTVEWEYGVFDANGEWWAGSSSLTEARHYLAQEPGGCIKRRTEWEEVTDE